jgi:hypothetical protein
MNAITRFNNALASKITSAVSTMWCAYIFAIIAFTSLPAVIATHNLTLLIAWVAQTFLQLVLLSVIMVGQKDQTDKTVAIHEDVKANHKLVKELHAFHIGGKHGNA